MTRLGSTFAAAALVAATAACLDDSITGTRTLGFDLTSDLTTATVGQDVTFTYDAQGTGLSRVLVDYGDAIVDSTTFNFATVEGSGTFVHSWAAAGTFVVRGRAVAQAGVATDSVIVTIN